MWNKITSLSPYVYSTDVSKLQYLNFRKRTAIAEVNNNANYDICKREINC